jgi:hypothetical protein
MSESILSALVLAPLILALVASVAAWRFVVRPVLFLVVAVLSLLGMQAVLSPVAISSIFFPGDTTHDAFVHSATAGAAGVVILGIPLLWWLFKGLRRA